ncbi:MAG: YcbK family protein [Desulfobulbaceae bacterium]
MGRKSAGIAVVLLLCAAVTFACSISRAGQEPARFFLMGSGKLHLNNLRNNKAAQVSLLNADGSFNEEAFTQVDRVFGYPTEEMGDHISPRLLFMLSYFADQVAPGRLITIESGYRSPDYNEKIRAKGANAARTSTHIDALALDFRIEGVDGKKLWETVRATNCCGVGHYGGESIHLDAGRPRFWEAATSGTGSKEPDYNRHMYLSTDFDRYPRQAPIRLSLSGISTFGFGVGPEAVLYGANDPEQPAARLRIAGGEGNECRIIADRKTARFLSASLPADLPAGRYRIQLRFCQKPFAQMPDEVVSREIELFDAAPGAGS